MSQYCYLLLWNHYFIKIREKGLVSHAVKYDVKLNPIISLDRRHKILIANLEKKT